MNWILRGADEWRKWEGKKGAGGGNCKTGFRKISKDEVRKALKRMKNGKTVCPDNRGIEVSRRRGRGVLEKTVQQDLGQWEYSWGKEERWTGAKL